MRIIYSQADGILVHGDCREPEVTELLKSLNCKLGVTDPPYGGIVAKDWDQQPSAELAAMLVSCFGNWWHAMPAGSAFYVWGGIGTHLNRMFLRFALQLEETTPWQIKNWITWSKKRAYGVQDNYLFTREELLFLVDGREKPQFNIPLLETKRGYAGYSEKYPAKSEYFRRTNVWTDITEIMRGKVSVCEKPARLYEIPIEVHTAPGDWVFDPFSGSGTCATACQNLDRRFLLIEQDILEVEKALVKIAG